ncbi:auxin-responsive protein saur32, partial [Nicotiana attenuata]
NHHLNFQLHLPHISSGVRRILNYIHFHHHEKQELKDIPERCLAVKVGQEKEQQRFIIPVDYINHPLFVQLLAEAEEEYGFDHDGPINIPCPVEEFLRVQGLIHKETSGQNSKIH